MLRTTSSASCAPDDPRLPSLRLVAPTEPDFETVYRENCRYVLKILLGGFSYRSRDGTTRFCVVKSTFDAEELTQEVFSAFFAAVEKKNYDPSRPLQPYLRRIAVNLALKKMGKLSREVLQEDVDAGQHEPRPLEDQECFALLAEFKSELDESDLAVLDGYYGEQRVSQSELGKQLGLSREQVQRRLYGIKDRALTFFKKRGWIDGA